MTERFLRPDVLVLAGGGTLGEAWMTGLLAGIEDVSGVDFRSVESFVGTSAGSIVAAALAAGTSPRRPAESADRRRRGRARGAPRPGAARRCARPRAGAGR